MQFLFNLVRIKGLYMFRALPAHSQEAPHNGTWHLACVLCQLTAGRFEVGVVTQAELGILSACYVSWLLPGLEWNWCVQQQFLYNGSNSQLT
jgi:hypothetical protein